MARKKYEWKEFGITSTIIQYLSDNQKECLNKILIRIKEKKPIRRSEIGLMGIEYTSVPVGEVLKLFDISRPAFLRWDCPKNSDGTFNLLDIINWKIDKEKKKNQKNDLSLKDLNTQKDIELKEVKINKELDKYILKIEHERICTQRANSLNVFLTECANRNFLQFANIPEDEIREKLMDFFKEAMNAWTGNNNV